jgi:anti-sigma B factor antagonist
MRFQDKLVGDVLVLRPMSSFIDASVSISFKGQIIDWIQQGHHRIVLDFSKVKSMDSSGLGAVVSLMKTVESDGVIVLCNLHPAVRNLFQITRFDRVISIHDSLDDACRSLSH